MSIKPTCGPEQRQTSFTWHPTLQIPTKIDESGGKHTVNTYDSKQPDQQDITRDGDVSSNRTLKWTYNAVNCPKPPPIPRRHLDLYLRRPRPADQQQKPRNHTITYGYDTAGRVNRITQPNGLIQRFVYNPRGWVTSQSQAAGGSTLTSSYTYAPGGKSKPLPCPTASPSPTNTTPPSAW